MSNNENQVKELLDNINAKIRTRFNCAFSYDIINTKKGKNLNKTYTIMNNQSITYIEGASNTELLPILTMIDVVLDDIVSVQTGE